MRESAGRAMVASYFETITRLEKILRELECEFLYLINDLRTEGIEVETDPDLPVQRLNLARHCLSAAAEALGREEPSELV